MDPSRADAARVWLVDPSAQATEEQLELYWSWLSRGERARAERFAFDSGRRLLVVGHALVRWALSDAAPSVAPGDWVFATGGHGRPELDAEALSLPVKLRFNLSHTRGLVACVVTESIDCGVDVERIDRQADVERLGQRVLTECERTDLAGRDPAARRSRFLAYWVVKEAYLKARGVGVSESLQRVELTLPDEVQGSLHAVGARLQTPTEDDPDGWQMVVGMVWQTHLLAVALRTEDGARRPVLVRHVVPRGPSMSRPE
jgi:4'-phosphopantetheinyl transferase